MPINLLHGLLHRVEDGWDPISSEYAERYSALESACLDTRVIQRLSDLAGGLNGKRVLDLGGGPGQYSVLFAKSGADVVWHDVSRQYEKIARQRAQLNECKVEFSLGYLEDASKFRANSFDLLFCRICWLYSRGDRSFAKLIYRLVKPGGIGHIQCHTAAFSKPRGLRWLQHELNARLWWKVGHPVPPHGRIENLIRRFPVSQVDVDYSSEDADVVTFVKANSNGRVTESNGLSS